MSFFLALFQSALRVRLTSLRVWLLLLLPLLTFGAVWQMPPEEVSAPVQVGVVLPEEGGGEFWRRLESRSGLAVTFHAASLLQAERQVAAGRWDCALLLPDDFPARLERLELEELLTLLIGPGSAVYPLVRETAAACLAECVSPALAAEYLLDSGILNEAELELALPRLNEILLEQDRVLVSLETVDGRPLEPLSLAVRGVDRLLAGLIAALLAIWALLTAMDLGRWLDSPPARRMLPLRGRCTLLLPRLAAALLPAFVSGALALLALERPWPAVVALVPYLLFWGAAALLLAARRALWSALPAVTPFVPVLCVLLSPMLLEPSLVFPAPLSRWTPVTLYLRACGGSWADALALGVEAAVLAGLCAALEWVEEKRGSAVETNR